MAVKDYLEGLSAYIHVDHLAFTTSDKDDLHGQMGYPKADTTDRTFTSPQTQCLQRQIKLQLLLFNVNKSTSIHLNQVWTPQFSKHLYR